MFDIERVYEPTNLDDAVKYLNENENSTVICGGTDVLIKNREGKLRGLDYVSIRELKELHGIYMDEAGNIHIGAASTFLEIEENEIIQKYCDFLAYAVGQVGGPQIRAVGTIGGNICNGVPSADSATSVRILRSKLHLYSVRGERVVDVEDFNVSAGTTVKERDEILTEIEIPKEAYEGYVGMYTKYAMRKAMDIATLGVAMTIKVQNDTLEDIRIAYGVLAATPIRAFNLENELKGKKISDELINIINEHFLDDINPRNSWRASKEFRTNIVNEVLKRSLGTLIEKTGGENVYSCGYDC